MPYISNEALLGAGLLVVLALAWQYLPKGDAPSAGGKSKKKNKKKSGAKDLQPSANVLDHDQSESETAKRKGGEPRKGAGKDVTNDKQPANGSAATSKTSETPKPSSFAGAVATPPKQKTLAEKLAPKEPKTKVDDMIAPEDKPGSYARVMSIKDPKASTSPPGPSGPVAAKEVQPEKKAERFEEDYAESSSSGEEENGWDVVQTKKKKPISLSIGNTTTTKLTSTSLPLPTETKVQRKNAKKAEMKKAVRAAEEEERQRRLAMHKRDLEKERINDIYGGKKKGPAPGGLGGGAKATLDHNGKLIWD